MSVRRTEHGIALIGDCAVEDAEILLGLLLADSTAQIDLEGCGRLHTAVAQVLLAARPVVRGTPDNPFVAKWFLPQVLDATGESTSTLAQTHPS
jgi:hypothetical protein